MNIYRAIIEEEINRTLAMIRAEIRAEVIADEDALRVVVKHTDGHEIKTLRYRNSNVSTIVFDIIEEVNAVFIN